MYAEEETAKRVADKIALGLREKRVLEWSPRCQWSPRLHITDLLPVSRNTRYKLSADCSESHAVESGSYLVLSNSQTFGMTIYDEDVAGHPTLPTL